jgi:hypothetical protein
MTLRCLKLPMKVVTLLKIGFLAVEASFNETNIYAYTETMIFVCRRRSHSNPFMIKQCATLNPLN